MTLLKKLALAPLFVIIFSLLIYQFAPFLKSYDFVFALSADTLIGLITLAALISLSSFLFTLFITLALDWKIVLAAGVIGSMVPMLFIDPAMGLILAVAIFVSFLLTYASLENSLKSYLIFKPEALLGPAIRHLSGLLILSLCLIYFLSSNQLIAQNGFEIPDSLIDTALKMTPIDTTAEQNLPVAQLPAISPDQLELLKQNPELLQQSGLDPKILDTLDQSTLAKTPQELTSNLIKETVKDQIQNFIKPYQSFIPAGLAILLFLSLQSLTSILNLLIYPLLWLAFYILEKTGFVKFEVEQRPVKKMVV